MKHPLKTLLITGVLGWICTTPLSVSAISLSQTNLNEVEPMPGAPTATVITPWGKLTVPTAIQVTENNKRYEFYANNGTNAFFRNPYGEMFAYQPLAYGAIKLKSVDHYPWSGLYEYVYRPYSWSHKTFESGVTIKPNTYDCGYKDSLSNTIGCRTSNTSNLKPNGKKGHTNEATGYRKTDSTFGGLGDWGESRFLGYSIAGNHIDNAYYPNDLITNSTVATYAYDDDVFNTERGSVFETTFDSPRYESPKREAVIELLKQEGIKVTNATVDKFMKRLSLQSNPYTDSPVFVATKNNGTNYQALMVNARDDAQMNLWVKSLRIYDKETGKEVVGIERSGVYGDVFTKTPANQTKLPKLDAGETYRLEVIVENKGERDTKLTRQAVELSGTDMDEKVVDEPEIHYSCGSIAKGGTCKFVLDYVTPDQAHQELNINAKLPESHYNTSGDNTNLSDDHLSLKVMINQPPKGDTGLNEVYLVEAKTNKVVNHPIQGVEYYFQFKATYTGDSMLGNELTFKVKSDVTTPVPQSNGTLANHQFTNYTNEVKTKLQKPLTLTFKSPTFKATSSTIELNATLIGPDDFKWNYNTNDKNDTIKNKWTAPINLTLNQVVLDPNSHPGGDYCGTVSVNYWIDFKLAYSAENKPLEVQKVEVAFYANGNYVKSERINVYANQKDRHYVSTLNLSGNCIKPDGNITVKVNPTHQLAESTMSDNNKTIVWKAKYPADYCQTHSNERLDWVQKYLQLSTITNGYGVNVDQVAEEEWIPVSNYETLKITKVELRSKLMTDKKMGPANDGWVNALNPGSDKIIIKAGYGFDLRVTVEYETNAYYNEKNDAKLKTIPLAELYTPLRNLSLTDNLFIKLPGNGTNLISLTTSDVKLERPAPSSFETSNTRKVVWSYTIANRLSPNGTNELTDSLFIDENTKDGKYSIDLYTLPISGVPGKTLKKDSAGNFIEYDPLCSRTSIEFEVNGSVYDDLNVGVIH